MAFRDIWQAVIDWRVGGLQNNEFPSTHSPTWTGPIGIGLGVTNFTPRRFFVWTQAGPPSPTAPAAGVAVHGVSGYANIVDDPPAHTVTSLGLLAIRGLPFRVETGGAFAAGGALKTDATGKAIAQGGAGVIVATALEAAAGAGEIRWAVFA